MTKVLNISDSYIQDIFNTLKDMQKLVRFFIIGILTASTTLDLMINSRAIAETKRSQDRVAIEILNRRQEVKNYENACNDKKVLNTLQTFRDFQTRLDTGINYRQYLTYLSDLKIAFSHIENPKGLSSDCYSLRSDIEYSLVHYESLVSFLNLKIIQKIDVIESNTELAKKMFEIYPELPVKSVTSGEYVSLSDFISYLILVAYL